MRQSGVWFATVLGLAACLGLPAALRAQVVSEPLESISDTPLIDPVTLFDDSEEPVVALGQLPSLPTYDQPAEPWTISLMPGGLLYRSYAAAERDPRLSTTWLWDQQGNVVWDSALGGRVGLVRFGNSSATNPEGFQLDVEGAAFVRLLPQEERDVGAVDFRAGIPLTYREGPWQAKFGYYHISSHLGDEFLLKHPGFNRLNYVRDSLVAGVGYFPVPEVRVYFEVGWAVIFTSGGAQPWEIQTGFEYDDHQPTGVRGAPYFALNIHLREEVNWGGSLNMLAGWQWRGDTTDHVFRIGLQFYNGKNAQYSFLQDNQQLLGFGVRYDY